MCAIQKARPHQVGVIVSTLALLFLVGLSRGGTISHLAARTLSQMQSRCPLTECCSSLAESAKAPHSRQLLMVTLIPTMKTAQC